MQQGMHVAAAGHCKRLAPAWGDLGQSLAKDEDVVVAHVDCTKAKTICSNAKVRLRVCVECALWMHNPTADLLSDEMSLWHVLAQILDLHAHCHAMQ